MKPDTVRICKVLSVAGAAALLAACSSYGSKFRSAEAAPVLEAPSPMVNAYLWRAALDTIDFMPISKADADAGLIVTEWFGSPNLPQERFKVNVYVLDQNLRADAIRASVFKQQLTQAGWIDAQVNPSTALEMENAILTRARELRLNSLGE